MYDSLNENLSIQKLVLILSVIQESWFVMIYNCTFLQVDSIENIALFTKK